MPSYNYITFQRLIYSYGCFSSKSSRKGMDARSRKGMDTVSTLMDFTHYWCFVKVIGIQRWVSSRRASNVEIDLFFVIIDVHGQKYSLIFFHAVASLVTCLFSGTHQVLLLLKNTRQTCCHV